MTAHEMTAREPLLASVEDSDEHAAPGGEAALLDSGRDLKHLMRGQYCTSSTSSMLLGSGDKAGEGSIDVDLESAVDLRVRPAIFIEFFLVNLLAPFSVVYVSARYGWQAARNMQLIPSFRNTMPESLRCAVCLPYSWVLIIASVTIYALHKTELESDGIFFSELVLAMVMYLTHKVMVGLKYATFTEGELRLFLRAPFPQALAYTQRVELLTGVGSPRMDSVYYEIHRAWRHVLAHALLVHTLDCRRTLQFTFAVKPAQAAKWKQLLSVLGDCSPFANGGCSAGECRARRSTSSLQVNDVLVALVLRSSAHVNTPFFKGACNAASTLAGISIGLLPTALRIVAGKPPLGSGACSAVFVGLTFVLTMTWWRVNALILLVIVGDYMRVAAEREMLCALITGDHEGPVVKGHEACRGHRVCDWPTIDLMDPSAVRVFALLWNLQLGYGRAFKLRMHIYNSITCAVLVLLGTILVVAVLQHGVIAESAQGEGVIVRLRPEDRLSLAESLPVNAIMLLAMVLSPIFWLQLRAGSQANARVARLRLHMLAGVSAGHARLEKLNHKSSGRDGELLLERRLLHQAIELLQHETNAMEVTATMFPVRILGLRASMELAVTFGTSFLTLIVFLLDRIYGVKIFSYMHLDLGLG